MKKKGWVVWTWAKLGSLLVFTGMLVMFLTTLVFVNSSLQAQAANSASSALRDVITDTYNSIGSMSFDYQLPSTLNGEKYALELVDKPKETIGIITRTFVGPNEVSGGASVAIPMAEESFGVLKQYGDRETDLCIIKFKEKIYVEKSKCS